MLPGKSPFLLLFLSLNSLIPAAFAAAPPPLPPRAEAAAASRLPPGPSAGRESDCVHALLAGSKSAWGILDAGEAMAAAYGPISYLASSNLLFLADPKALNFVFAEPELFLRPYNGLRSGSDEKLVSIFTAQDSIPEEDAQWKLSHDAMARYFGPRQIGEAYVPRLQEGARALAAKWKTEALSTGHITELQADLNRYSIESVLKLLFNHALSESEYHDLSKWLPKVLAGEDQAEVDLEIGAFLKGLLAERRSQTETGAPVPDDMMGAVMRDAAKAGLPDAWIVKQLFTILFAGQETTRYTLSWAFYELARHPREADRMRKDYARALEAGSRQGAEIARLPSLSNFVKEVLRLHPVAPMLTRTSLGETELGGYSVPAGTRIVLSAYVTHRQEAIWGADVSEFIPDRFADPAAIPKGAYFPFGRGARVCIGAALATTEMTVLLGEAVMALHFAPDAAFVPETTNHGGLLALKTAPKLRVSPREPAQ